MTGPAQRGAPGPELFDVGNDRVVCFNPGGRFHGWLFMRHADGQLVSLRQLNHVPYIPGADLARLLPAAPESGEPATPGAPAPAPSPPAS